MQSVNTRQLAVLYTLHSVRNGNFIPLDLEIVTNDDVPYEPSCQLGVKNRA